MFCSVALEADRSEEKSRVQSRSFRCRGIYLRHHLATHCVVENRAEQHRACGCHVELGIGASLRFQFPQIHSKIVRGLNRSGDGGGDHLGTLFHFTHALPDDRSFRAQSFHQGATPLGELGLRIARLGWK